MTAGVRVLPPGDTVMERRNHKPAQSIPQPFCIEIEANNEGWRFEIIGRPTGWQVTVWLMVYGEDPKIVSQRAYADNNEALEVYWSKVQGILDALH